MIGYRIVSAEISSLELELFAALLFDVTDNLYLIYYWKKKSIRQWSTTRERSMVKLRVSLVALIRINLTVLCDHFKS